MVVLPTSDKGLDQEGYNDKDPKQCHHRPWVPAWLQLSSVLSKQYKVVDNGPQLYVVIQTPDDHETAQYGCSKHKKPLLNKQRDDTNDNTHSNRNKNGDIEMCTEEVNINGCQYEPDNQEPNASTGEKYANIVETNNEDSCNDPNPYRNYDRDIEDPGGRELVSEG